MCLFALHMSCSAAALVVAVVVVAVTNELVNLNWHTHTHRLEHQFVHCVRSSVAAILSGARAVNKKCNVHSCNTRRMRNPNQAWPSCKSNGHTDNGIFTRVGNKQRGGERERERGTELLSTTSRLALCAKRERDEEGGREVRPSSEEAPAHTPTPTQSIYYAHCCSTPHSLPQSQRGSYF